MKSIPFLFLIICLRANAQQPADSVLYAQSVATALQDYNQAVKENLHIYNGSQYMRAGHGLNGTPFFLTDSLLPGALFYDGKLYENVPLHYDLVSDEVIINNLALNNQLILVPEKLAFFYAGAHAFVRITADSLLPSFISTGYYEKLFEGEMTVFARRQKVARQTLNNLENNARYAAYNYYFVLLNNTFYRADSKADFLDLAGDKKEALKKFIKDNKLKFNKEREASMLRIAQYYSQLKN